MGLILKCFYQVNIFRKLKEARDAYIKRLNGIYESNLDKSSVPIIRGSAKFLGNQNQALEIFWLVANWSF